MTAIIDYGVGNLFSLNSSLSYIGTEAIVTKDKEKLLRAERIILPGVGAFEDAVNLLKKEDLFEFLKELVKSGKPFLGICLGMQLLFSRSFEFGENEGLDIVSGSVVGIDSLVGDEFLIPHMGWNRLSIKRENELFKGIEEGSFVYFVHSYAGVNCEDSIIATAEYGVDITAAVCKENVFGVQFHPEKSGKIGLRILENFCRM